MILLSSAAGAAGGSRVIALFGVGLIGGAILDGVRSLAPLIETNVRLDWAAPVYPEQLASLRSIIEAQASAASAAAPLRVKIVWAAGKAGFGATDEEIAPELAAFADVVDMAASLARGQRVEVAFHMISSAGGMFEGQRQITAEAAPTPQRPYGRLKLEQERLLLACDDLSVKRIYRPTSVYSFIRPGQRRGLIATLVQNATLQRVTPITGTLHTLRDYVWAPDIGRYIARVLLHDTEDDLPESCILASGQPASIFQIKHIVERVVQRPAYVNYRPAPGNVLDITINARALPPRWEATDLVTNIRWLYNHAVTHGTVFSA